MRSANNVDLHIGARVAALNVQDQDWIFPGIIVGISAPGYSVKLDAGPVITEVLASHLWVVDLARDYSKLYWDYPHSLAKVLSRYPLPGYFNRSIPIKSFGLQLIQGMYLFANHAVFDNKVPQPQWQIVSIQAAGTANRRGIIRVSTRAMSLRHLFDTVCHEMIHLYQYKYVPAAEQIKELPLGMHGPSFLAWTEPLARIGVKLTVYDTNDADLEIPAAGKRDKEQIIILSRKAGKWSGGIAPNEKFARQLGLFFSEPDVVISLVRVRGAALMRNLLPVRGKRLRLTALNDNVIRYIRDNGTPLQGYELP